MVTDGILALFYALLSPLIGMLPTWELFSPSLGLPIANVMAKVDSIVPLVDPLLGVLNVAAGTFGALVGYRVGLFIYKRVRG